MSTVREAIKEQHRLARMRMGQDAGEWTDIPSMPGVRVLQVPLKEKESQLGVMAAAALEVYDNAAGLTARNRVAMQYDVFYSLREMDKPDKFVFDSVDEMVDTLEPSDIDLLHERLTVMMEYSSPAIDGINDEDFELIKKAFMAIDLSALTGRQWAAVKLSCQYLFPNLLPDRSLGTTPTESSTARSESVESI